MDAVVLQEEALQLPEGERALLADRLLESLSRKSEELNNAWTKESEERLSAFYDGKMKAEDGVRVIDQLRSKVSQ